jgi:hypothetical protein
VSAQEADRRRIGKDRLLGEGERREKYTEIDTERQEKKPKGQQD